MTNALRHFVNQFVAAWRSWAAVMAAVVGVGIGAMSVLLSMEPDMLDWGMVVILLAQVGWVAALVGAGSVNGTASSRPVVGLYPGTGLAARPNPAIPLDPGARVGAEALAGLAVMITFQVVCLVFAFAVAGRAAIPAMRVQALGDVAALPMAAAWLLPARSKYVYGLRGLAASLVGSLAVYRSISTGSPVPALLVSAGLAIALFATSGLVARIEGRSRAVVARMPQSALARRWREPVKQLWHDALVGPIEAQRGVLCAAVGAALAAFLLRFVNGVSTLVIDLLILVATFVPGLYLAWSPIGLFRRGASTRRGEERFGGPAFAGGMVLPLRREWVARAFYLHGLVAGAVFVGLCFLEARLVGMPMVFDIGARSDDGRGWLPWLLMLPSLGGVLACSAVGSRALKWLSLAALWLTWPAYLGGLFLAGSISQAPIASSASRISIAGASALAFTLGGGLPPLVFLFPRSTTIGPRQP